MSEWRVEGIQALAPNGKWVGDIITMEDGYTMWFPYTTGGGLRPHDLISIAKLMTDLDEPWDRVVQNDPSIGGGGE